MSRGETHGEPFPTGALTALACIAVLLLGVAGALLRPWHRERELMSYGAHTLILRVRGNALGSHCELEDLAVPGVVIPSACGIAVRGPELGPPDVVHTEGRQTCVIQISPLRELACLPGWARWMVVHQDFVAVAQQGSAALRVTEIDRATGHMSGYPAPSEAYVASALGADATPIIRVEWPVPQAFRLERDGLVPIPE